MKRITLLTMLLLPALSLAAQRTVTLRQCYDSAAVASPLSGEGEIHAGMTLLRDMNLASAWLPTLDLGGSFNYQSDVVDMSDLPGSMPIPAGSLPSIPHEQYRVTADISQVIWDGGVTRSAREVAGGRGPHSTVLFGLRPISTNTNQLLTDLGYDQFPPMSINCYVNICTC